MALRRCGSDIPESGLGEFIENLVVIKRAVAFHQGAAIPFSRNERFEDGKMKPRGGI